MVHGSDGLQFDVGKPTPIYPLNSHLTLERQTIESYIYNKITAAALALSFGRTCTLSVIPTTQATRQRRSNHHENLSLLGLEFDQNKGLQVVAKFEEVSVASIWRPRRITHSMMLSDCLR